ncbi:MAG: hypothetical protein ACHQNA_00420, partial [Acidimicrobiales bacterium]
MVLDLPRRGIASGSTTSGSPPGRGVVRPLPGGVPGDEVRRQLRASEHEQRVASDLLPRLLDGLCDG